MNIINNTWVHWLRMRQFVRPDERCGQTEGGKIVARLNENLLFFFVRNSLVSGAEMSHSGDKQLTIQFLLVFVWKNGETLSIVRSGRVLRWKETRRQQPE